MSAKVLLVLAGLIGAAGVTLGAYHAHGLEKHLERRGVTGDDADRMMRAFEVAVRYDQLHALFLLGLAGVAARFRRGWLMAITTTTLLGLLCFCGPLFLSALAGVKLHPLIVPFGGMLLIVAWVVLALGSLRPTPP